MKKVVFVAAASVALIFAVVGVIVTLQRQVADRPPRAPVSDRETPIILDRSIAMKPSDDATDVAIRPASKHERGPQPTEKLERDEPRDKSDARENSSPTLSHPVSKEEVSTVPIQELIGRMRKAVEGRDEKTLLSAVEELKGRGLEAAQEMLALLHTSQTPLLRRMAVAVMDDLLGRQFGAYKDGWYSNRGEMIEHVRNPANRAVIDQFRAAMVSPLVSALENDEDILTRRWAASALGQLGGLEAAHALARAIRKDDREFGVEEWAVMGLANIWDPEAAGVLADLARDPSFPPEGRSAAVRSLGLNPAALTYLEEVLRDETLTAPAAQALAEMQTPEASRLLEGFRARENPRAEIPREEPPPEAVVPPSPPAHSQEQQEQEAAERIYRDINERFTDRPFKDRLSTLDLHLRTSTSPALRKLILRHLQRYGGSYTGEGAGAEAAAIIMNVVKVDADDDVRCEAIAALGAVGTAETAKELERVAADWGRYSSGPVPKSDLDDAREAIYRRTLAKE